MQDTSNVENYDAIVAAGDYFSETKVSINGVEYDERSLFSVKTTHVLFGENNPTFGTAISGEIDIEMTYPAEVIPRMAEVIPYVRIYNSSMVSGWIQKGVYRIDTRRKVDGANVLQIHGYDDMMKTDQDYPSSELTWSDTSPRVRAVLDEIANAIGVELDDRTKAVFPIGTGYIVGFPAQYTMREVLCSIGAMYGGSFCMSDNGKLLFIGLMDLPPETDYLITAYGNYITFGGARILLR